MNIIAFLAVGLFAGIYGGALGLGGGTIMIPAFVILFGMTQHQAQGTALAVMLPPVLILAAARYYREGHINIPMAVYVAIGFVLGALIGAHIVQGLPAASLKRIFGIVLILVGIKMALMK